jgi:FeS assembly protein IscX
VTWVDAESIDPLTVRFTDLREKVLQLEGFADDPKASSEPKLEAIQMAWYEERQEAQES